MNDRTPMNEGAISFGLLWLRVLAGLGIMTHGYPKLFGGNMAKFAKSAGELGLPQPELMAWLAALSEFFGGLLLVLGLFTRPAALFCMATMSVAAFLAHSEDPFSVKEKALAYWTMFGALLIMGGGKYALERRFFRGRGRRR